MSDKMGYLTIPRRNDRTEPVRSRILHYEEFHIPMEDADRRAQASRCKACGVPFCQTQNSLPGVVSGCPLGNLIPEWNDLLSRGNDVQAYRRLIKTNPFPEFTSRVCPAPCEAACTGNLTGLPVANRENEKYLADAAAAAGLTAPHPPAVRSGKTVAVIGSGPTGLAAADRLNHRGHRVTVYERAERPGGLLMYGIPNMKLDKRVVEQTTERMRQEGVLFRTGETVGSEEKAQEIIKHCDAVVIACGTGVPRDVEAVGRDAEGILFALDYLGAAVRNQMDKKCRIPPEFSAQGKRVLVIGGGDTGTDCVATAVRQGCRKITQLIRRPAPPPAGEQVRRGEPLWPRKKEAQKTDYGQEEAAEVFGKDPRIYQTRVREFLKNDAGKLTGAVIVKVEMRTDAATGERTFSEIPGSEKKIPCEMALIAAGYAGPEPAVLSAFGLAIGKGGAIKTLAPEGHATSVPKVFAAGDCRRGQSLVVWAIREGMEAAREVDEYLMGYTPLR